MSQGINKLTIVGNLGRDPETGTTQSGVAAARFDVGCTTNWKDSDGVKQSHTEWHKIVAFGRRAEIISQFLNKGSRVYIEGEPRTRSWEGQDGQKKYITEVQIKEIVFLDKPPEGYQGKQETPAAAPPAPPAGDSFDDDIPW